MRLTCGMLIMCSLNNQDTFAKAKSSLLQKFLFAVGFTLVKYVINLSDNVWFFYTLWFPKTELQNV